MECLKYFYRGCSARIAGSHTKLSATFRLSHARTNGRLMSRGGLQRVCCCAHLTVGNTLRFLPIRSEKEWMFFWRWAFWDRHR